jgi:hypothetical protein
MARQLSSTHTRLIVTTDGSQAPDSLKHEYRVEDSDLAEDSKVTDEASPVYNQTVNALWTSQMGALNTAEGIS